MKAIAPSAAERREFKLDVYWDIEARDWDAVLCVCAVVSDGRRHVAFSIAEHLEWLESENLLRWDVGHWAHYGGIYDHVIALAECLPDWGLYSGTFTSGFNAWSADLRKDTLWWRLRDSARLYPCGLEYLGRLYGYPKGDIDREHIGEEWDARRREVIDYCLRDCDVLCLAMEAMRGTWASLGVGMRATLASTATALIRRQVPADAWDWTPTADRRAENAYYGGRTERFYAACETAYLYDIVSSYPAAMSKPLPTRLVEHASGFAAVGPNQFAIYHARVRVPPQEYPPLPYRVEAGAIRDVLAFPVGIWDGWFADIELAAAVRDYGVDVQRVHKTLVYDTEPYCKPFMDYWFDVKAHAVNPGERFTAKIALNSCYGKFIESPDRDEFTSNEERAYAICIAAARAEHEHADLNPPVRVTSYKGVITKVGALDVFRVTSRRWGAFRHAAAAAFVTAHGRAALLAGIAHVRDAGGRVYYTDTDSLVTSIPLPAELATGELGSFKLEGRVTRGEFLRAKLYRLEFEDGSLAVKAKGFRVPKVPLRTDGEEAYAARLARVEALWRAIVAGESVEWSSHVGARTALADRHLVYRRFEQHRSVAFGPDKRAFAPDGSSRPWSIAEVNGLEQPRKKVRRGT